MEIEMVEDREIIRLFKMLKTLEPYTDEYNKTRGQLNALLSDRSERMKLESADNNAKKDRVVKVITFSAGLVITPLIDWIVKRNLTKVIGTIEQMDIFTSTPGRSISKWF